MKWFYIKFRDERLLQNTVYVEITKNKSYQTILTFYVVTLDITENKAEESCFKSSKQMILKMNNTVVIASRKPYNVI